MSSTIEVVTGQSRIRIGIPTQGDVLVSVCSWNPKGQKDKGPAKHYSKMDNIVVMVNIVTISNHCAFTENGAETFERRLTWDINFSNQSQARSKRGSELEMTSASVCRGISICSRFLAAHANFVLGFLLLTQTPLLGATTTYERPRAGDQSKRPWESAQRRGLGYRRNVAIVNKHDGNTPRGVAWYHRRTGRRSFTDTAAPCNFRS
jgi:hypothetical protein